MISNSNLTIYHKYYDEVSRSNKWQPYKYQNIWWFGGKGASINKGYDNANDVEIRIPYKDNEINLANIQIGDILVNELIETPIETQDDLEKYICYNITSIKNNNFGGNPHIHLGGK